jgi:hypothetical protein
VIVAELIAALQQEDQTREVLTEGCDCWGAAGGIKRIEDPSDSYGARGPYVLIERDREV